MNIHIEIEKIIDLNEATSFSFTIDQIRFLLFNMSAKNKIDESQKKEIATCPFMKLYVAIIDETLNQANQLIFFFFFSSYIIFNIKERKKRCKLQIKKHTRTFKLDDNFR